MVLKAVLIYASYQSDDFRLAPKVGRAGRSAFGSIPDNYLKIKTKNLNDAFGVERSYLKYGICEVSIPNNHKIGRIEIASEFNHQHRYRLTV